jgi:hypothetical protein
MNGIRLLEMWQHAAPAVPALKRSYGADGTKLTTLAAHWFAPHRRATAARVG